jgi:threonylcarbamoyladenosine tRNA methylthiotransferase MtaB
MANPGPGAGFRLPWLSGSNQNHLPLKNQWLTDKIPNEDLFEELGIVDRQSECRAHIKIEDGCNSYCSYCAIPLARGRIRSREERAILTEAEALAEAGYREIVLTGIHVCSYGLDRGEGSHAVVALAAQLAQIPGIERIRLGSLEPLSITPAFIELARANPKLCPHFHLSLQSGSDTVLNRMNRRYTTSQFRSVAQSLREAFPAASLTTDVIVGFSGETDAEFAETLQFCQEIGFARMHVFRYSPPGDTGSQYVRPDTSCCQCRTQPHPAGPGRTHGRRIPPQPARPAPIGSG